MGGRLLDYIAQGATIDRPDAADMPARIAAGGASIYYANDDIIFSFFNADTVAWDELNVGALTGNFLDLTDVDNSTPPTDGQIYQWNTAAGKLIPIDIPAGMTTEQAQDIVGAMIVNGAGITVTYDDGAGTVTIACTVTQYTDENAMDAIAAMIAAGTHAGITVTYDDGAGTLSFTNTVTQYTDEMVRDVMGAALVQGAGISITPNDGADTIEIASTITQYTDELSVDAVAAALAAGTHVDIDVVYDDGAGSISLEYTGSGGGGGAQEAAIGCKLLTAMPALAGFTQHGAGGTRTITQATNGSVTLKEATPASGVKMLGISLPLTYSGSDAQGCAFIQSNTRNATQYHGFMIGFAHNANVDAVVNHGGNHGRMQFTNPTTRTLDSAITAGSLPANNQGFFAHVKVDATSAWIGHSTDGVNPVWDYKITKAGSFLTTAGGYTSMFIGLFTEGTIANDAQVSISVHEFDVDAAGRDFDLDGSGGVTGAGEVVIGSTTTTGSAASVSFSGIPNIYRHLFLRVYGRSSAAGADADTLLVQFNGDTGSNYTWTRDGAADAGSTFASGSTSATAVTAGYIAAATSTASYPGFVEMQIPHYTSAAWKKVGWCKNTGKGGGGVYQANHGFSWNNTAAITDILVKPSGANTFVDGSIVELVGIP